MPAHILSPAQQQGYAAAVSSRAGTDVRACYACGKCAAGCPVAPEMDLLPHQVLRLVQLGAVDEVLAAQSIWLCASCAACSTRCPNMVDLARVMDVLREDARHRGLRPGQPRVAAFHASFLDVLRRGGRLHELTMLISYKLRSGDLLGDVPMGVRMMLRGKLRLLGGSPARARQAVREIFRRLEAPERRKADAQ